MLIPSSAHVRFGPGAAAQVEASLHLSGTSHIQCCTYTGEPPILLVKDAPVSVAITVPDRAKVTVDDLDTAVHLAEAIAGYIAELQRRLAKQNEAADAA
jgi:hypothetical protein